jgi:hypothetical protein
MDNLRGEHTTCLHMPCQGWVSQRTLSLRFSCWPTSVMSDGVSG